MPAVKKKSDEAKELRAMADTVGEFIRYWGFRRIHGQLWTQIYLSKAPLSGADLTRNLGVSKALVSPALSELIAYQLIHGVEGDGRTKKYRANPEVFSVIQNILQMREKQLIADAQKTHARLKRAAKNTDALTDTFRLQQVGEMISVATFAIDLLIKSIADGTFSHWPTVKGAR